MNIRILTAALACALGVGTMPVVAEAAAPCQNTGRFEPWLEAFKKEAVAQGISARALQAAAPYLTLDQNIIWTDRGQKFFAQSFLDFSDKLASRNRLQSGLTQIKRHKAIFDRAAKRAAEIKC